MTGSRRRLAQQRGIALVSVVSVLVLLMIIATPFLLSMRDSARRGETYVMASRVESEAESLFERASAHLQGGIEHIERKRALALGAGEVAPPEATPSCDVPAEFQLPAEVMSDFNQASEKEHRVWSLRITDAQAKFNLNSCSVGVLGNLFGRARLRAALTASDDRIEVDDASLFPKENGVVRIGSELIAYKTADTKGGTLSGCTRAYKSDRPENGTAEEHAEGDVVFSEAAYQIATRPFRARPGTWVRYTTPYEARTISEMGVSVLGPDEFDRARRWLTAWNGNVVGDGWCNPQTVTTGISPGDRSSLLVTVKNIRYFGPGTVVRITDGQNDDFGIVISTRGSNQLQLAADVKHTYTADQTRIYGLARAPVNVNTADAETLALVFDGVCSRKMNGAAIDRRKAWNLAQYLKAWKDPVASAAGKTAEPGVFRTWNDFVHALEQARDTGGIINADEFEALLRNALNANDSGLTYSTVPLTFRSYDIFEARATAAIMGPQGQEVARRELTRVFEVSSARSATLVAESQADFQDQIRVSRDAKWFVTYPANVNAYYDAGNEPASEYLAYANKDRFPETDTSPSSGHIQLREVAARLTGRGRTDRHAHFDQETDPRGLNLTDSSYEVSVDGPYNAEGRLADLVHSVTLPNQSDAIQVGLRPFSCSFWYQPDWKPDSSDHVIFDYGGDGEFRNRVSLRYDGRRRLLILGCADATRETAAAEVTYDFAANRILWESGQWYHIAFTIYGCGPGMLELFVDAEQVGESTIQTRLTGNVPSAGDVMFLDVENANGFPDSGVLLLRAQEGIELFEYSHRQDTKFQITRRRARSMTKQLDTTLEVPRNHVKGEVVELYGFAAPLYTDVKRGGATLANPLGPWRVYRARGNDTITYNITAGGTLTFPNGIGDYSAQSAQNDIYLTEWTTGNPGDSTTLGELGSQGQRGIALLVSPQGTLPGGISTGTARVNGAAGSNVPQDDAIGGVDVVLYEIGAIDSTLGLTVKLIQRHIVLRHYDPTTTLVQTQTGFPRWFSGYTYGGTTTPLLNPADAAGNKLFTLDGTPTAFVPIAISGTGSAAEYLDPADGEPHLANGSTPGFGYVQIDSEWIKYDTYDANLIQGQVAFYRDTRINDIAQCLKLTASTTAPVFSTSGAGTGGSGGTGTDSPPPHATDGNIETNAPPVPTTGTGVDNTQPMTDAGTEMKDFAAAADFRSWEDRSNRITRRIANTIARTHNSGAQIIPCFAVIAGNERDTSPMGRLAYGGFDDLITLRDRAGNDEQIRIQWGYQNWMGPTAQPAQTWRRDRPNNLNDLWRYPSQCWTRALKFPSREMPDGILTANVERMRFGKRYDDNAVTGGGFIDEVEFQDLQYPPDDRRDYAFLGAVPSQYAQTGNTGSTQVPLKFPGIDDKATDIPVFMPYYVAATNTYIRSGLPVAAEVFQPDGGCIKIDDELILYTSWDPESGQLGGCVRGCFLTAAVSHDYGAIVIPVESFAMSRLTSPVNDTAANFEIENSADFPDDGAVRIGDGLEIAGYCSILGNQLTGPLGRIDPGTATNPGQQTTERLVGGALFRGRFGTTANGYNQGDVVMSFPIRHYDRYAERSDDPENSYIQLSWTRESAVWKRVTWDETPVKNAEVIALVRFSGGPAWDCGEDRVIDLGSNEQVPKENRRGFLYLIRDPSAENLLNVEADRIEIRLMVKFDKGAYDREVEPHPNEWKETPLVKRVLAEYVSPTTVMSQESEE